MVIRPTRFAGTAYVYQALCLNPLYADYLVSSGMIFIFDSAMAHWLGIVLVCKWPLALQPADLNNTHLAEEAGPALHVASW